MDGIRLVAGDSAQVLPALPDGCADVICTDPPYNLAGYSTGNIAPSWRAPFNNDVAQWDEAPFDPADWADELCRLLAPTGTIFAFTSYNLLGRWHEVFDPRFDTFQMVVWHKTNPPPKLRRAGFLNACELVVALWDRGHHWNFGNQRDMHNFVEAPICMGRERLRDPFHPTQKPLAVLRRLLGWAAPQGGLVLDPFMGVGSTGVAAQQAGCRFLGVERDETYVRAAARRLGQADFSVLVDDPPDDPLDDSLDDLLDDPLEDPLDESAVEPSDFLVSFPGFASRPLDPDEPDEPDESDGSALRESVT